MYVWNTEKIGMILKSNKSQGKVNVHVGVRKRVGRF